MNAIPQLAHVDESSSSLYQDWQKQVLAGNSHFESKNYVTAITCYNCAIAIAEDLIKEHDNFRLAIVSMIVSYHNLSDVYLMQSEAVLAERLKCSSRQVVSTSI